VKLVGKIAIITGAASGIGAAIAECFGNEGATVVAADLASSSAFEYRRIDVSVEEDWTSLIEAVLGAHGRIDILVNAAGVSLPGDTIEACTPETLLRTFAVNLDGVFLGCKHVIPAMRRQGEGSIINIGSILGRVADGASAAYTASKGGVGMLTKSAALHLAKTAPGVRCNQVSPSYTLTPMVDRWLDELPDGDAHRKRLTEAHPAGRLGLPADIAAAALYLASDESRAVIGADFVIDGGFTAR
jgi:3(or 17)beta-hydroxysteroid dehydrogenase